MTLATIDRTIYETIRRVLVSSGNLPDITLATTAADYESARLAIQDNPNMELIDLYGVGSNESRGKKNVRITVDRSGISPGQLGGGPATCFESYKDGNDEDKFRKYIYPEMSSDVSYSIRTIGTNTSIDRLLNSAVLTAFGHRRYLKEVVNDHTDLIDTFLIAFNGSSSINATEWVENLFNYSVRDAWILTPILIQEDIIPINSVNFNYGQLIDNKISNLTENIKTITDESNN